MQETKVRENQETCKYGGKGGHEKSPNLEMLVQERLVQQKLSQEKLVQQSLESDVSEMRKTSGNMTGISEYHKRGKNMTEFCDVVTREPKEEKRVL